MIAPGDYDIILTNGLEISVLKKKAHMTRGENKMALMAAKNNQLIPDAEYRKILKERKEREEKEEKEEGSAGVTGNAGNQGNTAATTGKQRPDTTSSMVSEMDESHNRLGSAEIRNRPGSASTMGRTQDLHTNVVTRAQVIDEDPAENEEDKFMVKMMTESGEMPFEMVFIFEDENGVTEMISRDQGLKEGGYFQSDNHKEILSLEDARNREGYYRMVIQRRPEVTQFSPVHVMINCNGVSNARKFSKDPFTAGTEQYLDYAVFKCMI